MCKKCWQCGRPETDVELHNVKAWDIIKGNKDIPDNPAIYQRPRLYCPECYQAYKKDEIERADLKRRLELERYFDIALLQMDRSVDMEAIRGSIEKVHTIMIDKLETEHRKIFGSSIEVITTIMIYDAAAQGQGILEPTIQNTTHIKIPNDNGEKDLIAKPDIVFEYDHYYRDQKTGNIEKYKNTVIVEADGALYHGQNPEEEKRKRAQSKWIEEQYFHRPIIIRLPDAVINKQPAYLWNIIKYFIYAGITCRTNGPDAVMAYFKNENTQNLLYSYGKEYRDAVETVILYNYKNE